MLFRSVLVFDYLAEITMSLLIRAKAKDPAQGYAPDFVATMKPLMKQIKTRGIQVIANAGGVNPSACRDALVAAAQAEGVDLKIAAVLGDDLMPQVEAMRAAGTTEMFSGAAFPENISVVPTPTWAPSRSPRRWPPAPTSSSPAAASTAR